MLNAMYIQFVMVQIKKFWLLDPSLSHGRGVLFSMKEKLQQF